MTYTLNQTYLKTLSLKILENCPNDMGIDLIFTYILKKKVF